MSSDILPTIGRVAITAKLVASKFLFAVSRGNPSWDSQWETPNPPTPPLEATNVLDLIGYARPTIVDFLKPDDSGQIQTEGGARFSISATPTRYLRVRLALPVGAFSGQTMREIGMFVDPVIPASVPSGQTVLSPSEVTDKGSLLQLHWREPQPLQDGSFFARNFIVRI